MADYFKVDESLNFEMKNIIHTCLHLINLLLLQFIKDHETLLIRGKAGNFLQPVH